MMLTMEQKIGNMGSCQENQMEIDGCCNVIVIIYLDYHALLSKAIEISSFFGGGGGVFFWGGG